jgi:predicted RNA binding protein YcfA (HicA-like mRNA interferase family)
MPKLPRVFGRRVVPALERLGFVRALARQPSRHDQIEADVGRAVCVVPLHDEVAVGTLRGVLRQAGVSADEFLGALR